MPSTVYSTHFFSGYVATSAQASAMGYTVPAGKVAVVRSVDMFASTPGSVFVGRLLGGLVIPILSSTGLTSFQTRHWDGDQVHAAGVRIQCQWIDGVIGVNCSGFLLNAVP